MVLGRIGLPIVVLDHAEEAELTLLGVTRGAPVEAPLLVVDIGGGSTEAVVQAPGEAPRTFIIATGSEPPDPDLRTGRSADAGRSRAARDAGPRAAWRAPRAGIRRARSSSAAARRTWPAS